MRTMTYPKIFYFRMMTYPEFLSCELKGCILLVDEGFRDEKRHEGSIWLFLLSFIDILLLNWLLFRSYFTRFIDAQQK